MKTIVLNSQKGGSGKTALCRVLSVQAAYPEKNAEPVPVYLIDTDPQGTLNQWHDVRQAADPRRVEPDINKISETLVRLKEMGAEYVFIDTPPQASQRLDHLFKLADLVLVPIKPTPDDLKAATTTVSRLKALAVPYLFVITQAIQNTNITAQAIAALSHHGAVAETLVVNRVIYPAAFTDGRTPQEIEPHGPAAREIRKLWDNIQSYFHTNIQSLAENERTEREVAHA